MTPVGRIAPAPPSDAPGSVATEDARLRRAVKQLEGVFVEQLFKAMRETVPKDGMIDGGTGEEVFSGLLDQHLAGAVPGQWENGIGEALFRQLRSQLSPPVATGADEAPDAGAGTDMSRPQ